MNLRQQKKHLKMRIRKLESDNKLMKDIINDYPGMQELYDLYNTPHFVNHSYMHFEKCKCMRAIPPYMADLEEYEAHIKRALIGDLAEVIKNEIQYEVVEMCGTKTIEATIYIGRKE